MSQPCPSSSASEALPIAHACGGLVPVGAARQGSSPIDYGQADLVLILTIHLSLMRQKNQQGLMVYLCVEMILMLLTAKMSKMLF